MSSNRKLMQEVDRTLKRIAEGNELFDEIWEKVQNAAQQNQKEKYEQDLKKEIKKLQRLREQVKGWATNNEIRDKEPLLEGRRSVESRMERFKELEREMKTKAYSREGLQKSGRLSKEEQEQEDCKEWVQEKIDVIKDQQEAIEADIEGLSGNTKKKAKNADKLAILEERLRMHKWHIEQLELIIRAVDNDVVEVEEVERIKDDIYFYIESNTEEDCFPDDTLYDPLELEERMASQGLVNTAAATTSAVGTGAAAVTKEKKSKKDDEAAEKKKKKKDKTSKKKDKDKDNEHDQLLEQQKARAAILEQQQAEQKARKEEQELLAAKQKEEDARRRESEAIAQKEAAEVAVARREAEEDANAAAIAKAKANAASIAEQESAAQQKQAELEQAEKIKQQKQQQQQQQLLQQQREQKAAERHQQQMQQQQQQMQGNQQQQSAVKPPVNPDLSASRPSLNLPALDLRQRLSQLDSSLLFMPDAADSDRPKSYVPKQPSRTPPAFPTVPPPIFETPAFVEKLDVDTLFLIFFHQQDTYSQYLAARELKRKSWRYHKRYGTWFQRYEDPQNATSEYEEGTYVYFDNEAWSQNVQENFVFEYSSLEDELPAYPNGNAGLNKK